MAGPCYHIDPRPENCLFGGFCTNNSWVCTCPEGFSSDDMLFHNGNCALPNNAILGFFIYYSLMCILVSIFLYREWRGTINLAFRLGAITLFLLLVSWFVGLTAYIQQGYFEGIAFLCFIAECASASLTYHLFLAFIIPLCTLYRIPHKRIKTMIKTWSIIMCFPFFGFMVALCVHSRRSNETFNWIQCAHLIFILFANVVFVTILILQARNLIRLLHGLSHSNMPSRRVREIQMLLFRTKLMTAALCLYLLLIVVSISALILMLVFYASALYGWIFSFLVCHFSLILGAGIAVFLRQRYAGDRSSIGFYVERGEPQSDHVNDDYKSYSRTATNTKNFGLFKKNNESGIHKGMLSGLGEEEGTIITQISDDGAAYIASRVRSHRALAAYQSAVPPISISSVLNDFPESATSEDRVVRRGRAGDIVTSSPSVSAILVDNDTLGSRNGRKNIISGRSNRSSRREVVSSVFESEVSGANSTWSLRRKKVGRVGILSRLKSSTGEDGEPDF